MNRSVDIGKLIKAGEGESLEFKSRFKTEVIETLVAFANSSGRRVLVGINDKHELSGVTINPESVQNWINEIKTKTSPALIPDATVAEIRDKKVVVFSIPEYPIKPVATRGKYFKRIANSNHLMSLNEIANEHLKTINSSWDFYPDPNHSIEHISLEKVHRFISLIEQHAQTKIALAPMDFLAKLEIVRKNHLTFGGYLLFVREYCVISDVQVGRFKSPSAIIDSISVNTDLFSEVDEILFFIRKHLMVEYIITGEPQRTERFDYPIDAIREIVINMIVHRDYRDSSHSIIKIFDDKIEFFNPGKLYGSLTIADLLSDNYTSQTRNKLIAKAFKEIGLIERYGSGIRRIINICSDHGLKQPLFEEAFHGFRVTLFKAKLEVTDKVTDKVTDDLTGNQNSIVSLIQKNNQITTKELSDQVKISQRKIKENLSKLKDKGIIKRIGPARGGYWQVIQQ
ncbi:MAG: winged helix-turn-helix transcriptional regulator [Desulfobacteraceae bacterium]|nr:MAG: winged helix-turn-helix transcriptional regulator [Desulfobacteraceae bacterium]